MNHHSLSQAVIKSYTPEEKHCLVISSIAQLNGKTLVVSRFGDNSWDFYPYLTQENLGPRAKRIEWQIALPDGKHLTDPEHALLLESTKDFIWSLFSTPVEGRKRPSLRTIISKFENLVPLLRWMVKSGIRCYSDLSGRTLECVQILKQNSNNKSAAEGTVAKRLIIIEDLYHQRHKINDGLHIHPWPHETAVSLAGLKFGGAHRKPKTRHIPDDKLTLIVQAAFEYVQVRSIKILDTLKSRAQSKNPTAIVRKAKYSGLFAHNAEMIRLRTACYIVISAFSGIRDSEVMSLGEACIKRRKSSDGGYDLLWMHGTIYKTGLRAKAWQIPPIVEEAIIALETLTEPLRASLRNEEKCLTQQINMASGVEQAKLVKRLDTVQRHKDKLFLTRTYTLGKPISVLTGSAMFHDLKKFCAHMNIHDDAGDIYPLHSHQFRRTYARCMARSELGDLITLRDHFGHYSLDMTTYYTDGGTDEYEADIELIDMIAEEKQARQSEIINNYLDSDAPLANGGHWLKEWRSTVRTASNKEELIAQYAGAITLNGTGHSWCVGNAKGIGCGGLCIFQAQMCVDCNYGIIGPEHRPVWEGIRDQQLEALELNDIGESGSARAKEILEHAEKVLNRLDGKEAT